MEKYNVMAIINFTDYLGKEVDEKNEHIERKANQSTWKVSKERYEYLASKNAVYLIGIDEEKPKKATKKTTKKKEE